MDKRFFQDIATAFDDAKDKFEAAGVPPVKFIDRFRGQPMNPERFEYYPLPALFIQCRLTWERVGRHYNARLQVLFHVVTEPTWDTSNIATNRDEGLKYYTFLDQVRDVIDNFKEEYTGTMFRAEDENIDADVVFYDVLGYNCDYYGNSELLPGFADNADEDTGIEIIGRKNKKKL